MKNLISFAKQGEVGKWPYYDSDDTAYHAVKNNGNLGYAVLWRNRCKHSHVMSRMEIMDVMNNSQEIPLSKLLPIRTISKNRD